MVLPLPFKDPDEVLDYGVNWAARLVSDTISTSSWIFAVDPDSALNIDSNTFGSQNTTVFLSGGTLGQTYELTNRITTAGGRTMDQTVKLKIKSK